MTARLTGAAMALALAPCSAAPGQTAPPQSPPSYTAAQLHCARFAESSRADIETETAGHTRRAVAERDGVLVLRARDATGGVALEAWYDSLALRHGSRDSLLAPDTDGLVGGRYRGLLRPSGEYRRVATPFVPAQVAEAFDAAAALDDLFPRLPPEPLAPGTSWSDGEGLEIERLADSSAAGAVLQRYLLRRRGERSQTIPEGDSVPVPLRQATEEEWRVVWHPDAGFLRGERRALIRVSIPAGGRIRSPVRSRVEQRVTHLRLPPAETC